VKGSSPDSTHHHIRPAFEANYVKLAEGTASGRLVGLIIFSAHEISRGIHATKLSHAPDNACPTENFPSDFWDYAPDKSLASFPVFLKIRAETN
jgi:hypothetical protein